jgi:hypothetical protein
MTDRCKKTDMENKVYSVIYQERSCHVNCIDNVKHSMVIDAGQPLKYR